jgi:glycosyltransferase involved in cell wall biosynthesis
MKIALVVHTAYPEFIGGREHHVHNLASVFSNTDEVIVISGSKTNKFESIKINGYCLIKLPMVSIKVSSNPLQIYRIIPKLFSTLKQEKPDIIHAFEYGSYSTDVAFFYSKRYGIPFIITVYGYQLRNPVLKFFKKFYDHFIGKPLFKKADRILCPSTTQSQEILKVSKSESIERKIMFQENCIRVDDYKNIIVNQGLLRKYNLNNEVKLLTIARIVPRKGLKYLVLAMDKVVREYDFKNIKLMIIGPDCGELRNIKFLIKNLGLENYIIIIGSVQYKQIKDFLSICDIFVLPSLYEGSPLALLEAMAAAKAVIFSNLTCARKVIINGKNGLLVKSADPNSLAEAIITLSRNKNLCEHLGLKAKKTVRAFDSSVEARNTREYYKESTIAYPCS